MSAVENSDGIERRSSARPLCALVVEDDRVQQRILERELRQFGIEEIAIAVNGREGLREFLSRPIDIVITDWNMPDGSGLDLTLGIRATEATTPVIMVTSECDRLRVKSAIMAGVNDYILKPIDKNVLFAKLQQWVGSPLAAV